MGESLLGLSLGLGQDILDLWVVLEERQSTVSWGGSLPLYPAASLPGEGLFPTHRIYQQFGAEETDTAQNLHCLHQEAHMKHRLGQLNVAKVARTLCHVSCRNMHFLTSETTSPGVLPCLSLP